MKANAECDPSQIHRHRFAGKTAEALLRSGRQRSSAHSARHNDQTLFEYAPLSCTIAAASHPLEKCRSGFVCASQRRCPAWAILTRPPFHPGEDRRERQASCHQQSRQPAEALTKLSHDTSGAGRHQQGEQDTYPTSLARVIDGKALSLSPFLSLTACLLCGYSVGHPQEFILSILEAQPSARDTRSYFKAFAPIQPAKRLSLIDAARQLPSEDLLQLAESPSSAATDQSGRGASSEATDFRGTEPESESETEAARAARRLIEQALPEDKAEKAELVESLLNPVTKHVAVVKIQGPFRARQIESIIEGLIYLEKLGLTSIIVLDDETWQSGNHLGLGSSHLRNEMIQFANDLVEALENKGARSIALIKNIFRLKDDDDAEHHKSRRKLSARDGNGTDPAVLSHTTKIDSIEPLRAAIRRGEIPVIPPIAYDMVFGAVAVPANDAVISLVSALAEAGAQQTDTKHATGISQGAVDGIDLTPLRMMIINREGGVPSPARGGNPHLSINLASEYDYIHETFIWQNTHPTSLQNLALVNSCLLQLPRESSAVIVSHRSPKSLIANLITNKPAHSPSLHHSLLPAKHMQHFPTIVRRGLPIRVIRDLDQVDKHKLTKLMESSFRQKLNEDEYYARLERDMDFIIVAGEGEADYQAAAIVTLEKDPRNTASVPISYLDKFAVLPSLQGDGTVDFLWTALRDETFGLGLLDALNPNGGKEGIGFGTDLVWRSRADNPVNKWYFERSNGHIHLPEMGRGGTAGTLFWCDAEDRIIRQLEGNALHHYYNEGTHERRTISMVMQEEEGRLSRWTRVIGDIKSCWVTKDK